MWLGSQFCAEYITRHRDVLRDVPSFWTREQRGEEASAWLVFRHKLEYLAALSEAGRQGPRRAFCIPESAVAASNVSERVMLFLAIALMESFRIAVDVGVEPDLAAMPGFVTDRSRRAIVATW